MPNAISTRSDFQTTESKMREAGFPVEKIKQEVSFALQHINKSQQLQDCTKESLQVSVLNIANIGLSLNPASKEAYLIPRWNGMKKQMEAVLEPGYIGLIRLLTDSGSVKAMLCNLVYDNDKFQIDLANNTNPVTHLPELKNRGEIIGCYALATLNDNNRQVEYMDVQEINDIRERSETYKAFKLGKIKSCTWISDYGEMARKTVIKRIYKYLPRTDRMQKIDEAISQDNSDYSASDAQVYYIENLLNNSTLEQRQRDNIFMELPVMGSQRATEVIEMLKQNQLLENHHK